MNIIHCFSYTNNRSKCRIFCTQFNMIFKKKHTFQRGFISDAYSRNLPIFNARLTMDCHQIPIMDFGLHTGSFTH